MVFFPKVNVMTSAHAKKKKPYCVKNKKKNYNLAKLPFAALQLTSLP